MYSREYQQQKLRFEASGGLIDSSLVLQDKETNTFWSIMSGEALVGELAGTELEELPGGVKVTWKEWAARHPDTLVLSLNGREDIPRNAYEEYFLSERSFQNASPRDRRLAAKQGVFAFRYAGRSLVVPFQVAEGGAVFHLEGADLFFYRSRDSHPLESTSAYLSRKGGFELVEGGWRHESGSRFLLEERRFETAAPTEPVQGFDTYWYTWTPFHPETEILGQELR